MKKAQEGDSPHPKEPKEHKQEQKPEANPAQREPKEARELKVVLRPQLRRSNLLNKMLPLRNLDVSPKQPRDALTT